MKLWPFAKKNKGMDNSFELPPGVVLAEFDGEADAAPYIPVETPTGELLDPAPPEPQAHHTDLDMIMMPSTWPDSASTEPASPPEPDPAKTDLGAFFEQNHLTMVSQGTAPGEAAAKDAEAAAPRMTAQETGSILDVLTPPATQDIAMPVESPAPQTSQAAAPDSPFEAQDPLGSAGLFDFSSPQTPDFASTPALDPMSPQAPPASIHEDLPLTFDTVPESTSNNPLEAEQSPGPTDWLNDTPLVPAADLNPFAATEADTFENAFSPKQEADYAVSADAERAFWNSPSILETTEQTVPKASEPSPVSNFDSLTTPESDSFYGLGHTDTAFPADTGNSLYLAAPASELEASGSIWDSTADTDESDPTGFSGPDGPGDPILELAPSAHLDEALDLSAGLSEELANILSGEDLTFSLETNDLALAPPPLAEEAQASFLAHEPVTETMLSEGSSDWIGEISESFEDGFDNPFGVDEAEADAYSVAEDAAAVSNGTRVTEEGLEVYEPGSDLESYDLGYYTDPEDEGACFDLDTLTADAVKEGSFSLSWSEEELAEALEDSALKILAEEAAEPVLELAPPDLKEKADPPRIEPLEHKAQEPSLLRLVPPTPTVTPQLEAPIRAEAPIHMVTEPAAPKAVVPEPPSSPTDKPAPKTVAEVMDDFEQSILLQESRFLKKSIDDLVSNYFAKKEGGSAW